MCRITSRVEDGEYVLKLEGCLQGAWVQELAECWQQAKDQHRRVRVDLTDVYRVDASGRELMAVMFRHGVSFVTKGCVMPEVVREISKSVSA